MKIASLALLAALLGASALHAMEKSKATEKLSSDDKEVLNLINTKVSSTLSEVRILVRSLSPEGLALLKEDPLANRELLEVLSKEAILSTIIAINIKEKQKTKQKKEKQKTKRTRNQRQWDGPPI